MADLQNDLIELFVSSKLKETEEISRYIKKYNVKPGMVLHSRALAIVEINWSEARKREEVARRRRNP